MGISEEGEICIRTPYTFLGYAGMPNALKDILDEENFIHSGDVGYINEKGVLFISGRKKDIIKYKGYQVTPSEIENLIYKLQDVAFVCVVGVPDPIVTHLATALVIPKPNSKLTENEIVKHVAGRYSIKHFI